MGLELEFHATRCDLSADQTEMWRLEHFLRAHLDPPLYTWGLEEDRDAIFHDHLRWETVDDGGPGVKRKLVRPGPGRFSLFFGQESTAADKRWQAYRLETGEQSEELTGTLEILTAAFRFLGGALDGFWRDGRGDEYPRDAFFDNSPSEDPIWDFLSDVGPGTHPSEIVANAFELGQALLLPQVARHPETPTMVVEDLVDRLEVAWERYSRVRMQMRSAMHELPWDEASDLSLSDSLSWMCTKLEDHHRNPELRFPFHYWELEPATRAVLDRPGLEPSLANRIIRLLYSMVGERDLKRSLNSCPFSSQPQLEGLFSYLTGIHPDHLENYFHTPQPTPLPRGFCGYSDPEQFATLCAGLPDEVTDVLLALPGSPPEALRDRIAGGLLERLPLMVAIGLLARDDVPSQVFHFLLEQPFQMLEVSNIVYPHPQLPCELVERIVKKSHCEDLYKLALNPCLEQRQLEELLQHYRDDPYIQWAITMNPRAPEQLKARITQEFGDDEVGVTDQSSLYALIADDSLPTEERLEGLLELLGWPAEAEYDGQYFAPWLPFETPADLLEPFMNWEGEVPDRFQRLVALWRHHRIPGRMRAEISERLRLRAVRTNLFST